MMKEDMKQFVGGVTVGLRAGDVLRLDQKAMVLLGEPKFVTACFSQDGELIGIVPSIMGDGAEVVDRRHTCIGVYLLKLPGFFKCCGITADMYGDYKAEIAEGMLQISLVPETRKALTGTEARVSRLEQLLAEVYTVIHSDGDVHELVGIIERAGYGEDK